VAHGPHKLIELLAYRACGDPAAVLSVAESQAELEKIQASLIGLPRPAGRRPTGLVIRKQPLTVAREYVSISSRVSNPAQID
jgi:hypothetical protein